MSSLDTGWSTGTEVHASGIMNSEANLQYLCRGGSAPHGDQSRIAARSGAAATVTLAGIARRWRGAWTHFASIITMSASSSVHTMKAAPPTICRPPTTDNIVSFCPCI